jgi:hypothetical protein
MELYEGRPFKEDSITGDAAAQSLQLPGAILAGKRFQHEMARPNTEAW